MLQHPINILNLWKIFPARENKNTENNKTVDLKHMQFIYFPTKNIFEQRCDKNNNDKRWRQWTGLLYGHTLVYYTVHLLLSGSTVRVESLHLALDSSQLENIIEFHYRIVYWLFHCFHRLWEGSNCSYGRCAISFRIHSSKLFRNSLYTCLEMHSKNERNVTYHAFGFGSLGYSKKINIYI